MSRAKTTYKIVNKKTSDLIPYANNSRTHSDDQVAQIASSIKEFGFTNPILIDGEGSIIAGHGRVMAAKLLDLKTVPCIPLDHLSEAQKKAYVIADNKLALNAGWDDQLLRIELQELQGLDFDLSLTGFDDEELDCLLNIEELPPEGDPEGDFEGEPPEDPITKLGDVWILGKHRLMCGDSTSIDAVEKLMDGKKADMVFTDPPYNIDFKPNRGTHGKILNDKMSDEDFNDFLYSVFLNCYTYLKKDTYLITFMGWSTIHNFRSAIIDNFKIKSMPIWVKNNFGIGYYTRPQYEPFFLCLNGDPKKPNCPPSDVFNCKKVYKTLHSCEKPTDLIIEIMNSFNNGGLIYEPFGGSGSTLIACCQSGRLSYNMELDPKYCDVIIKRFQEYTGQAAVLESTGETFEDMQNERK